MKSILSLFLTLSLFLAILCTLAACKDPNTEIEEHTHTFADSYNFDDVFHWRVCTDESCGEIVEEEHTLVADECFCGFREDAEDEGDADDKPEDLPALP